MADSWPQSQNAFFHFSSGWRSRWHGHRGTLLHLTKSGWLLQSSRQSDRCPCRRSAVPFLGQVLKTFRCRSRDPKSLHLVLLPVNPAALEQRIAPCNKNRWNFWRLLLKRIGKQYREGQILPGAQPGQTCVRSYVCGRIRFWTFQRVFDHSRSGPEARSSVCRWYFVEGLYLQRAKALW